MLRVHKTYRTPTTRDERIAIKTALQFKVPYKQIEEVLDVSRGQIEYARDHPITPQKSKCGAHALIRTPQRRMLENWLLFSPSHRRLPYRAIPFRLPELQDVGERAIRTAFDSLGYCRRSSKKKGFSTNPEVCQERTTFAEAAVLWSRERLYCQMFSDEVWAMGGAHSTSYVTVRQDGSDRLFPENLQHKYSKGPAWMLHGTIIGGRKGPATFWEKEWGTMNSAKYDYYILSNIQAFMDINPGLFWMQDNAPSHNSRETLGNLERRQINNVKWP